MIAPYSVFLGRCVLMNVSRRKLYFSCIILSIFSIFIDQLTKYFAEKKLVGNSIRIIDNIFSLTYLQNRGVGFGLLQNRAIFIILVNLIVIFFLFIFFLKTPLTKRMLPIHISISLIISGAIGNMIDRIRLGYVIDFFYFELIDFPIFNVADIYVSVSIIILAILLIFYYSSEEIDNIMSFKRKN